jgi:hypothetical protein
MAIMAAMECNDISRAETLLTEYTSVYPEAGEMLREEVLEGYGVAL